MTAVVKSEVLDLCFLQNGAEAGLDRVLNAKDANGTVRWRLASQGSEFGTNTFRHPHSPRLLGFSISGAHSNNVGFEVHIEPRQLKQLTATHSRVQRCDNKRSKMSTPLGRACRQ